MMSESEAVLLARMDERMSNMEKLMEQMSSDQKDSKRDHRVEIDVSARALSARIDSLEAKRTKTLEFLLRTAFEWIGVIALSSLAITHGIKGFL